MVEHAGLLSQVLFISDMGVNGANLKKKFDPIFTLASYKCWFHLFNFYNFYIIFILPCLLLNQLEHQKSCFSPFHSRFWFLCVLLNGVSFHDSGCVVLNVCLISVQVNRPNLKRFYPIRGTNFYCQINGLGIFLNSFVQFVLCR